MKIPSLAVYNTLAEKTSIWCKCFKKEKNSKIMFFFLKIKKFVIFKIEKKWKLIAYYDSAYPT